MKRSLQLELLIVVGAVVAAAVSACPALAGSYGMTPGDLREVGGEPTWQWRPRGDSESSGDVSAHPYTYSDSDMRFRPRESGTIRALDARVYGQQAVTGSAYAGPTSLGSNPYTSMMSGRYPSSISTTGTRSSIAETGSSSGGYSALGSSMFSQVRSYSGDTSSFRYSTPYQSFSGAFGSRFGGYSSFGGAPSSQFR